MKRVYTLLSAVLLSASLWAQAPQSFSYQAVMRGLNNELMVNKPVGMKISLLQGSENGSAIYVETHNSMANANGLVSIAIGGGTKDASSTAFASIDWSNGPYFIKTETDLSGGTKYNISTISQFLSVPYALYAEKSGTPGIKGDAGKDGMDGATGLQGIPGVKGDKGDTGLQGPIGLTGVAGATGKDGVAGAIGSTGPKGDTGVAGPQGIPGLKGDTGIQGIIGLTGVAGADGKDGVAGATGLTGPKGDTGVAGPQGIPGEKGDKGDTGLQGPIGLTGATGKDGVAGAAGATGPKGDTGVAGPQGIPGLKGDKGDTGIQGPIGLIGVTGATGKDGVDGAAGPTGPKGASGPQGIQGAKGDKGDTGIQGLTGLTGLQGIAGVNGTNGSNGAKGQNALVNTTTEGAGANCLKGGVKLEYGLDANNNSTLEANEINASLTKFVCNGNGYADGTSLGQINYWNGTDWVTIASGANGQTLTFCNSIPVWTTNGKCPGIINSLNSSTIISTGNLIVNTIATGVSSEISYTGGNGGEYSGQTIVSTGVTGLIATLQAGTFANGNGSLIYTITGTPTSSGNATFTISVGGQTIILTRVVDLPVGILATIDCAGVVTNNGTLTQGTAASSVNSVISYTAGNGGTHSGQIVTSTAVTGLTATLQAGTFANGNGSLTYVITGTPASAGTASFAINIGGKTCTLTRTINLPVGIISTIDCATPTNTGTLTQGTVASGVSSVIAYTGGNGGTQSGQTVTSTGVTGLTATLQAGTFASGNGSLTYTITGTPASAGTASFAINIGGKTGTLSFSVAEQLIGTAGPDISDVDGNTYKTVFIGTQQWMRENLKISKYNDGTTIPNVTDATEWSQLTAGAWVYYKNDPLNNDKYGKLYNWYAVSPTKNGNKNVCPTGWHVPIYSEWSVLIGYLGGGTVGGGKMKEVGTTNWKAPNEGATNSSLFTGLPGGQRMNDGFFFGLGDYGYFWTSSENSMSEALSGFLYTRYGDAYSYYGSRLDGFSVRCLKD